MCPPPLSSELTATALRLDIKLEIAKLVHNTYESIVFVCDSESQILMNNEDTGISLDDIGLGT